jgi:hypothetical protein
MKNQERSRWMRSLLFLVLFCGWSHCARAESSGNPPAVSLCEVLSHPTDYSDRTLTLTVRITATKEGSFLWVHGCKSLGVVTLVMESQSESESGIKVLEDMLRSHGLSDHPVIATLTGTFTYDPQANAPRYRAVFKARAASGLKQSEHVERRVAQVSMAF